MSNNYSYSEPPQTKKQSVPRRHLLRKTSCERYGVPPLHRYRNSLEYVAGFETILSDLFDSWPKITQEIRCLLCCVHWTECFDGYPTGTKMYLGISSRYFSILRLAACSAAAPAVFDVPSRCEAREAHVRVSGEVASQRRHFPACHGVKVTPSGCLASVRCKPSGSLVEWMFALDKDLQIMSLSKWWRSWRPAAALLLHESPCVPKASTNEPQRQGWGSQRRLSIRKATAALTTSFPICRPHEDIGRAFSHSAHSPEWTACEASNLARSRTLVQLERRLDFVSSIPGILPILLNMAGNTDLVRQTWLSLVIVPKQMLSIDRRRFVYDRRCWFVDHWCSQLMPER